jgi:uncharacterized secreted protein with C-terminal beta-propeller domain
VVRDECRGFSRGNDLADSGDMRRIALIALIVGGCGSDSDAPTDHVQAVTTELHQYSSCDALEADLKQVVTEEVFSEIDNADRIGLEDGAAGGATNSGTSGTGGGRTEGVDYSGTNNQETGVDEADLVKADGYHLYALNGNRLHIFGTPNFGDLVPESITQLEGHPTEMLLDATANRAVVFSIIDVYSLPDGHPLKQLVGWQDGQWYWRISQLTKITVLDITDRTAPQLVREVYFEGWYDTARKVDSTVRMAAYSWLSLPWAYGWWTVYDNNGRDKDQTKVEMARRIQAMHLSDLIPQMYVRTPDGRFITNSLSTSSCEAFYRPSDSHARGIASVISFDLLGDNLFWDADHVISNWPTFYESQDRFVIAESAHDYWWYYWFRDDAEQTNIHVFDSSQAGQSHYIGSGRINGSVSDQFSLDEQDGNIRVAATSGGWWHYDTQSADPIENHIYVLSPNGNHYDLAGKIDGITVGERLTASRFLGDQGYLTTYKNVDPLVTLDLSDPKNPHVVGELTVPGYSTYLHPMGTNGLLSIGIDTTGWGTTNISMFDTTSLVKPALTTNLPITQPGGWTWSEAMWEHKAFTYWEPKGLLAIPSSNYGNTNGTWSYLSKLELISVDPTNGSLTLHGEIDHSPYYNADGGWWQYVDIRRSVFMGDYVYAISDKAITVHQTADLAKVNEQVLPGYTEGDWYWWW